MENRYIVHAPVKWSAHAISVYPLPPPNISRALFHFMQPWTMLGSDQLHTHIWHWYPQHVTTSDQLPCITWRAALQIIKCQFLSGLLLLQAVCWQLVTAGKSGSLIHLVHSKYSYYETQCSGHASWWRRMYWALWMQELNPVSGRLENYQQDTKVCAIH